MEKPADVAPGLAEGVAPGSEGGGSAADQLKQLVGGVQQGLDMLRGLMEATPGAPAEAKEMLDASLESFMGAMQLMVAGGGEDEGAAEMERPSAEMEMAEKPAKQFKPKTMGSL
jgi:hypothetical protein